MYSNKRKKGYSARCSSFVKNGVVTFPVNCGWEGAKNFAEHFKNGQLKNIYELEDDKNHPQILLSLLDSIGLTLKSYVIMFEAEWADIPCEGYQAAFENGNVAEGSIWEMGISGTLINAFEYFGLDGRSDVYFSYDYGDAKREYLNSIGD